MQESSGGPWKRWRPVGEQDLTVSSTEARRAVSSARVLLACLLLASCFEIPPRIPDDDGTSNAHPPVAVYERNPFAAKNRWFQRAFDLVDSDDSGRPRSGTAEPLASADKLEIVDLAELTALSEAAHKEDSGWPDDCREQLARVVFHCDALALRAARGGRSASPAAARLDLELGQALERISRGVFGERPTPDDPLKGIDLSCWDAPPPLRAGGWEQVRTELPSGLFPASKDLRWTTVRRREMTNGSRASALLRHRVAGDGQGGALPLPLPSECWILERTGEEVRATVWRFDRAASLAGEEPWRRLPPEEEFSIRDPLVANGEWRSGNTASLCLGCHGVGKETPPVPLLPSTREAQLERVKEILAEMTADE